MRTFKSKPPEVECSIPTDCFNTDARVFAIQNALQELVYRKDYRFRNVGEIIYHEHSMITKYTEVHPSRSRFPYSVIPVINLGYLESRTIEQGVSREDQDGTGYVRIAGLVFQTGFREQNEVAITRVTYEVIAIHEGKLTNYTVTDTYVEGDVKNPEFTFVSKMV